MQDVRRGTETESLARGEIHTAPVFVAPPNPWNTFQVIYSLLCPVVSCPISRSCSKGALHSLGGDAFFQVAQIQGHAFDVGRCGIWDFVHNSGEVRRREHIIRDDLACMHPYSFCPLCSWVRCVVLSGRHSGQSLYRTKPVDARAMKLEDIANRLSRKGFVDNRYLCLVLYFSHDHTGALTLLSVSAGRNLPIDLRGCPRT